MWQPFTLTLTNYRCFGGLPLKLLIAPGRLAILGTNNVGKSAVLRALFELRNVFGVMTTPIRNYLNVTHGAGVERWSDLPSNTSPRPLQVSITSGDQTLTWHLDRNGRAQYQWTNKLGTIGPEQWTNRAVQWLADFGALVNGRDFGDLSAVAQAAGVLSRAYYLGAFRNAINSGGVVHFDASIGTKFIERWYALKAGSNRIDNEKALSVLNDIATVFGFSQFDANAAPGNSHIQVTVNRKSYDLNDLGSGVTQFFVAAANVATSNASILLLDEPETNLHPRLQVALVELLGKYATHGVMFTTHSLGLARSCADRIMTLQRDKDGHVVAGTLEKSRNVAELLGELSFAMHQDLGAKAILLVEGVTDVPVLRHFVRLLGIDSKVVLLPIGGSSWFNDGAHAQLLDLKRIAGRIYAIIDSERTSADAIIDERRQQFQAACAAQDIACLVLEKRAIENYLAIKAEASGPTKALFNLGPYDKPREWDKWQGADVASRMSALDLRDTDIGQFLERITADLKTEGTPE